MLMFSALAVYQMGFAQFSWGVEATANLASATVKDYGDIQYKKDMKLLPGAGAVVQYAWGNNITLRSGVQYQQKGVKVSAVLSEIVNHKVVVENNLHYVQVPLYVLYNIPLNNLKLYAGAGAYAGYGFSGKSKVANSYTMPNGSRNETHEKVDAFSKDDNNGAGFKKGDAGLSFQGGLQLSNGIYVQGSYQLGLTNLERSDEGKYRNNGIQLTVGYFFKGK